MSRATDGALPLNASAALVVISPRRQTNKRSDCCYRQSKQTRQWVSTGLQNSDSLSASNFDPRREQAASERAPIAPERASGLRSACAGFLASRRRNEPVGWPLVRFFERGLPWVPLVWKIRLGF